MFLHAGTTCVAGAPEMSEMKDRVEKSLQQKLSPVHLVGDVRDSTLLRPLMALILYARTLGKCHLWNLLRQLRCQGSHSASLYPCTEAHRSPSSCCAATGLSLTSAWNGSLCLAAKSGLAAGNRRLPARCSTTCTATGSTVLQ